MEGLVWEGSVDSPSPWTNIYIDPPFSDTWVLNNDGARQTSITAPTTVPTLETDPVNDRSLPQHSGLNKRGSDDVDTTEGSFPDPSLTIPKRRRLENSNYNLPATASSSISFQLSSPSSSIDQGEADQEGITQMKEMIYCAAAFRPVSFGPETVEKPQRKNVRTSSDPQTVAARQRRERISDRMRVLQRIVPGGTKMDTASMLDEAANYLKFLQTQIEVLGAPKFLDSSSTLTTNCNLPSWRSRSL